MKLITNIYLTDDGVAKFNGWFQSIAKKNVDITATCLEALGSFQDDLSSGFDPHYELSGELTNSGRASVIFLSKSDFDIEYSDDE